MPIEIACPQCKAKLRIEDRNVHHSTKCPNCSHVFQPQTPVAAQTQEPVAAHVEVSDRWQVRFPDGRIFGPSERNEIIQWIQQSRVPPGSQVCREGESEWIAINLVFAGVSPSASHPSANPSTNPYQAPTAAGGYAPSTFGKPHRGEIVLALGLIGLISAIFGGLCCILAAPFSFASPIAWYLGKSDLREMDAGAMNPQGRSSTQAGMICGIIGTICLAIALVFFAGLIVVGIFQEM